MNTTLDVNEIKHDMAEIAIRCLWKNSGVCELKDLVEGGADEALVSSYGPEVIQAAMRQYKATRVN